MLLLVILTTVRVYVSNKERKGKRERRRC